MADAGAWGSRHPGWPAVLGPLVAAGPPAGEAPQPPPSASGPPTDSPGSGSPLDTPVHASDPGSLPDSGSLAEASGTDRPPKEFGAVGLRPLHRSDGRAWREIRIRDQALIARWDASSPQSWPARHSAAMWRAQRVALLSAARRGEALPFAITIDGVFAGQVTVGGIQRGALQSGWVGYWVDSRVQGRRVATRAVALAVAHLFGPVGLHRVEATISPANAASRAVVGHLGFREEGLLRRYLDIDGAWRDHLLYALTVEDLPPDRPLLDGLLGGGHQTAG